MAVRNPPFALQNITLVASGHTAQNDRLNLGSAFAAGAAALSGRSGMLVGPAGGRGEVSLLSNVLVRVAPFRAVIQGTRNAAQGQYLVANDANVDLAVAAQAASTSRRDLVIVNVRDTAYAPDTLDSAAVQVVTGTAAASNPADPALGGVNLGNYFILGTLVVPPTGTAVTFTPAVSPLTVSAGGIRPADTADTVAPLFDGQYRDHPTRGLERGIGGGWAAPVALSWVDILRSTTYSQATTVGSAYVSLPSLDVNLTGLPPGRAIEVEFKAPYVTQPASSTTALRLAINATVQDVEQAATSTVAYYRGWRLSGSSVVPASGVVPIQVQGMTTVGSPSTVTTGTGTNVSGAVYLRYRIR